MKKSLLALAVLGAFAGAASAQSSVTLYGRVDLSVARNLGTDYMVLQNGSGSRLGVRGVEDLGGGLKAIFNIEHRFAADVGQTGSNNDASSAASMWHGRSIVGLQGNFGEVRFGREYTPNFLYVQLAADPWGYDTVAANGSLGGGIDTVRANNTLTYSSPNLGGFRGHVQWIMDEVPGNDSNGSYALALTYAAGPLSVGFGRIDFDNVADWNILTAAYDFGVAKIIGGYGFGKVEANDSKRRDYHIAAVAPVGPGEFRVSYNKLKQKDPSDDLSSKFGLGYHYPLSKRTTVYADYARDGELDNDKWGFDVGIKHNF
ncbi:MAG TPA: porin [Burkholderiaceae bacterium]|nr:porin [Burkholderiaceae bacterium]